ncbi:MAG: YbgA family protein [Anaerolineae bacterium]
MRPCGETGLALRLGISACLLGQNVRYDGGHQRDRFLEQALGPYVEWVPVCPEVELGLGTPREALRLVGEAATPRLVQPKAGRDLTDAMSDWAQRRAEELAGMGLHGFVFKKDSPSCGLERVRVYGDKGPAARRGRGLFARELVARLPCLPVEEDGRLQDPRLRENLIERLFTYCRWQQAIAAGSREALVSFHEAQRLTLLAHGPRHYRQMGHLLAQEQAPLPALVEEYGCLLTGALHRLATPARHAAVLRTALGALRRSLTPDAASELEDVIADYRRGLVPLVVPITLLQHHLRRAPVPEWLRRQTYLNPYPKELMLRNHV